MVIKNKDFKNFNQPFYGIIKLGYSTKCIPFVWCDQSNTFYKTKNNKDLIKNSIVSIFNILGQGIAGLISIYLAVVSQNIKTIEILLLSLFLAIFIVSIFVHICLLLVQECFINEHTSLFKLSEVTQMIFWMCSIYCPQNLNSEIVKKLEDEKKNLRFLYNIFSISPKFIFLVGATIGTYVIHNDFVPFNRFNTGYFIITFLLSALVMLFIFYDFIGAFILMEILFTHTFFLRKWIREFACYWNKNLTRTLKWKLHILWGSFQIQNSYVMLFTNVFLPIALPIDEFILVIFIYALVRLDIPLPFRFCILVVSATIFIFIKVGISGGAKLIHESQNAIYNLHKLIRRGRKNNLDYKRLISYCKLRITIGLGASVLIKNETFIRIMHDIIISSVVNLLLIF